MKTSPLVKLSAGVVEFGVGVIDRDFSFQRFVDLDFGSSEAEAFRLRRDVENTALPLHDIVVADVAFVHEAADAVQVLGGGTPSGLRFPWCTGETAVVIGQEAAQDSVGTRQIGSAGQTEFAGEAVLKSAPEAFDASLGLRRVRGDIGDPELFESTAELGGLAFAGELFFERPVIIIANEDTLAIAV